MLMFYTDLFCQKPRRESIQPWLGEHAAPKKKAVRVVNDQMSKFCLNAKKRINPNDIVQVSSLIEEFKQTSHGKS